MANAGYEGVHTGRLCGVEYLYRTGPRRDYLTRGKPDPLMLVLREELVTFGPIVSLVFFPIRMDPLCDLRRQTVY